MLTSSMPALTKALADVLPQAAIKQLTQSIGNCAQPLTHRGPVNMQAADVPFANNSAGPGASGGGTWNPAQYRDLLPTTDQARNVDMPGFNPGGWNLTNYGGGNFYFPTSQEFTTNQFYGGPTYNVAGDTNFTNQYVDNSSVVNLTVKYINGWPAPVSQRPAGPPGAPGAAGEDGFDGWDGRDAVDGRPGAPGANGRDGVPGVGGGPINLATKRVTLIRAVRFNPQTCRIEADPVEVTVLMN